MLPAREVAAIVRSAGFVPISPAMSARQQLCAAGERARRPGDARHRRRAQRRDRVRQSPVVAAGPGGERLGAYERMDGPPPPHGYVPPPPIMHDNDRPMARPQAVIPNAPPRTARGAAPETPDYMPPPSAEPPAIMRGGARRARSAAAAARSLPVPRGRAVPPAEKPAAQAGPCEARGARRRCPSHGLPAEANRANRLQRRQLRRRPPAPAPAPAAPVPEGKVDPRSLAALAAQNKSAPEIPGRSALTEPSAA